MNNFFFKYLLWLLFFVLLQTLVFSQLPLGTCVYPMVYISFILLFPIGYSQVAVLLWAFLLGFCVDIFVHGVLGAHTAAAVATAYVRPFILKLVTSKDDRENNMQLITRESLGNRFFLTYISLAILIHHMIYFLIDTFSFFDFLHTVLLVSLSALLSILFVFLLSSLVASSRRSASL